VRTPRQDLADAIRQLNDDLRFRVFVRRLSDAKADAVSQCLDAPTKDDAEPFRLEARAYDRLLKDLKNNGAKDEQAPSSSPPSEGG
jgi:hypothetical protein